MPCRSSSKSRKVLRDRNIEREPTNENQSSGQINQEQSRRHCQVTSLPREYKFQYCNGCKANIGNVCRPFGETSKKSQRKKGESNSTAHKKNDLRQQHRLIQLMCPIAYRVALQAFRR